MLKLFQRDFLGFFWFVVCFGFFCDQSDQQSFVCPFVLPPQRSCSASAAAPKGARKRQNKHSSCLQHGACLKSLPAPGVLSCFPRPRNVPWNVSSPLEVVASPSAQQLSWKPLPRGRDVVQESWNPEAPAASRPWRRSRLPGNGLDLTAEGLGAADGRGQPKASCLLFLRVGNHLPSANPAQIPSSRGFLRGISKGFRIYK